MKRKQAWSDVDFQEFCLQVLFECVSKDRPAFLQLALAYNEAILNGRLAAISGSSGGMDVLSNILQNSLTFLNSGSSGGGGNSGSLEDTEPVFVDLRQLEEYSLAGMVCLLQQVKPHLSKGDAMWCLLMSDLHVGRASVMEIPVGPLPGNNGGSYPAPCNGEGVSGNSVGVTPALCRFHGGWGFGNGGTSECPVNGFFSYAPEMSLQREIECPKRFNLTPSMKTLLKRNVAMFAAGFRANSKESQMQSQPCDSSLPSGDSPSGIPPGVEVLGEQNEEPRNSKNQDVVNLMLSKFRELNLDENMEN
ncbi:hypothetical protein RJ640_012573 [Escallonia rubra]|uniref:Uncharacterized protein n=1 Tax=Escallonia rubra TaxID=112253 RepID=A0AA88TYZ6_9ASTE|nr:hypothetical protein RJ640_012573 [Escallonia rubra]